MGALFSGLLKILKQWGVQILTALGISFVSYVGYDVAMGMLQAKVAESSNSMTQAGFQLFLMSGFGEGINLIFGAFAARISFKAMSKLTAQKAA